MFVEELYKKHQQELLRFALSISRNEKEAEDIIQETFLRALTHTMTLNRLTDYQQRAWLYKVSKNILYDKRRRDRFEVALEAQHEPLYEDDQHTRIEIQELMDQLPTKYQDVIYKRYWLGMNSTQIAKLLSIPPSTVRYRLHVALTLMRNKRKRN